QSSFKVSNLIVKNCKPFSEGEFVKECFFEIADYLFEGFKNKKDIIATIQDLQLLRNTTVRRMEMTCGNNGLIALCRQYGDFPDFLSYRCIIHQQVLASKRLNTNTVMEIAFKIINSIRGKSLQRPLFNPTPEEGPPDITLHTDVRWLSRYKFLQRFRSFLSEMNSFLEERGDEKAESEDEKWLFELAFLAVFTGKLI
ncbi:hypothetical protein B7P43_G05699, partial [Cryptotermes secundus]